MCLLSPLGTQVGLHLSGSIRLVKVGDRDRALEAKHHHELAKLYDDPEYPTTLLTPSEIAALHPLVDASHLELGLRTVSDGDVDPTLLTNALAADAKAHGAELFLGAEIEKIEKLATGEFKLHFVDGSRSPEVADAVVNATGLWSQRFSAQMGLDKMHPAFVIEHHYAVTEPIETLAKLRARGERVGFSVLPEVSNTRTPSIRRCLCFATWLAALICAKNKTESSSGLTRSYRSRRFTESGVARVHR